MISFNRVAIIIVNYCTPLLTIDCLKSIAENCDVEREVTAFVLDNKSKDDSVSIIETAIEENSWGGWVSFFPLEVNGGFAYGNNKGIQKALSQEDVPDFIWLLNPDTVIYPNACESLVRYLDSNNVAGIVGSRLEDPDGTAQISAFKNHSIVSEFLSGIRLGVFASLLSRWKVAGTSIPVVPVQADWLSGASLMVRKEVFEEVGLLDENFFMYYEEADFCMRARLKSWQCHYVPLSRVVHLVGAASGILCSRRELSRRPGYWFESRHRFFLKNYGCLMLLLSDALWIFGYSLWAMQLKVRGKENMDPPHFFKDFVSNSIFCKGGRL